MEKYGMQKRAWAVELDPHLRVDRSSQPYFFQELWTESRWITYKDMRVRTIPRNELLSPARMRSNELILHFAPPVVEVFRISHRIVPEKFEEDQRYDLHQQAFWTQI